MAAGQFDVVGHSMGGLIARAMMLIPTFFSFAENGERGFFRRIIVLGTPHLGSPHAIHTLDSRNSCLNRSWDRIADGLIEVCVQPTLDRVTIEENGEVLEFTGGTNELRGRGDGRELGEALTELLNPPVELDLRVPIAHVFGVMSGEQLRAIDARLWPWSAPRWLPWLLCGDSPYVQSFTSVRFVPEVMFGQQSDAIVPVRSGTHVCVEGAATRDVAHGPGTIEGSSSLRARSWWHELAVSQLRGRAGGPALAENVNFR